MFWTDARDSRDNENDTVQCYSEDLGEFINKALESFDEPKRDEMGLIDAFKEPPTLDKCPPPSGDATLGQIDGKYGAVLVVNIRTNLIERKSVHSVVPAFLASDERLVYMHHNVVSDVEVQSISQSDEILTQCSVTNKFLVHSLSKTKELNTYGTPTFSIQAVPVHTMQKLPVGSGTNWINLSHDGNCATCCPTEAVLHEPSDEWKAFDGENTTCCLVAKLSATMKTAHLPSS